MWQRDQVVSISARDRRFESDFQPCKINLTHTFGTPSGRSQTTVDLLFRLVDRVTLPDYRAPTSSPPVVLRNININKNLSLRESERYIHSPGRSATRLTAYHIYGMWLVRSNT